MFDLSFLEILVVFVVALLVLGPEKFHQAIITSQKILRRLRFKVHEIKQQIDNEMSFLDSSSLYEKQHLPPPTSNLEQSLIAESAKKASLED
jgi:sec-independent protein translocase protein TatB